MEDCDNCLLQAQAGVKSIAQIPATIAARHFINEDKQHGEGEKDGAIPQPMYVVLNMLGQVRMLLPMCLQMLLMKASIDYYHRRRARASQVEQVVLQASRGI